MFATLLTRRRLLTTAASAVTFAILACHPTLARSIGADIWNVSELKEQVRSATDESARLSAEDDTTLKRIAMKEAVVQEVLAGRASLAEATARFAELNAARPHAMETIRTVYPGATDREKTARNVISFTLGRAPAEGRAALSRRLDTELQQIIAGSSAR